MANLPTLPRELLDLILAHIPQEVYTLVLSTSKDDQYSYEDEETRVITTFNTLQVANDTAKALTVLEARAKTSIERSFLTHPHELDPADSTSDDADYDDWMHDSDREYNIKTKILEYRRPLRVSEKTDSNECDSWHIYGHNSRTSSVIYVVKQEVNSEVLSMEQLGARRQLPAKFQWCASGVICEGSRASIYQGYLARASKRASNQTQETETEEDFEMKALFD